jgi:hypothetical protein
MHRLWKKIKAGPFLPGIAALAALAALWLVAAAPWTQGY